MAAVAGKEMRWPRDTEGGEREGKPTHTPSGPHG